MNSKQSLKNYMIEIGHTEEEAEEIVLEYNILLRVISHPNNLYDIVDWLGWFERSENETNNDKN